MLEITCSAVSTQLPFDWPCGINVAAHMPGWRNEIYKCHLMDK